MRINVLCVLLAAAPLVTASAQDLRVETSGRDKANYPPPRHFDHLHMRLSVDIPDMEKRFLTAEQTLTLTPIGRDRSRLELRAKDIKVESVSRGGQAKAAPLAFTHEQGKLTIIFDRPVRMGEKVDVVTRYSLDSPRPSGMLIGGGLTWTRGKPSAKEETAKYAQIHSQGQPEFNHQWFPCHDFPNERLTTEMIVTVEDPFIVSSNGRLLGTTLGTPSASGKPRMTWRWTQDKAHPNYLVTLVVGRFSIVGLPAATPEEAQVCNYLYAPVGSEKSAATVYGATPAMVAYFSNLLAEPYPWDKYSQALCRGFSGGMENTSATTMSEGSANAPPGSQDDIIAHELGHQWFGDFVTCKSWEHAWLNEGWASFCEALWAEGGAAPGRARREYQRKISGFVRGQGGNRTVWPAAPAMASRYYNDPFMNFIKANDIYAKGALVLHMLRMQLGDEVFWRGVQAYLKRHRLGSVETDDFRYCLEEVSGRSLERFFNQWCFRPGMPRLGVEIDWTPDEAARPDGSGALKVTLKQTQRINADNPAYALSLPISIKIGDRTELHTVEMDTVEAVLVTRLGAKPGDVTVDPDMTVVAPASIRKPLTMWLEQIGHESVFARLQAADHLTEFDDPAARAALLAAGHVDEVSEVRSAALESLARMERDRRTAMAGGAP